MPALQDFQEGEAQVQALEAQWLFRQGALVLGPVPGRQLVDKLFTGEVTADTAVTIAGHDQYRRLAEVGAFQVPAAQATVKARVEAEARAAHERLRRQGLMLTAGIMGVTLLLAAGAWLAARAVALRMPRASDTAAQVPAELPALAVARSPLEAQLFAYGPGGSTSSRSEDRPDPAASPAPAPPAPAQEAARPQAVASARPTSGDTARTRTPSRRKGSVATDADGLQMETNFDQDAINRVIKAHQRSLFHCFQEEARRRPGFSAKVPLEFAIGNDGRVAALWVDHPELKKGALYNCLFAELRKWPFPPYAGERATVSLSFSIGKGR